MDPATYDALICDFYRAATGAIQWNDALEKLRHVFRARCAPLQTMDLRRGAVISVVNGGPDMERPVLDYIRKYHRFDPRAQIALKSPPGQWLHCSDYFNDDFAASDRFFQEFLPSYDSRYASGLVVPLDAYTVAVCGIQLSATRGPLNADERVWVQRLAEHLREALLAYERVRKLAAEALAGHALLSAFPYPMCLIDAERFVFFTNRAAQREIETGCRLALRGPRLALVNDQSDRNLSLRISALMQNGHGASTVLDLRPRPSDPPAWLHLSVVMPGQALGAFGEQPQILATLFDPNQVSSLDPFALANMFDLTPAEAKVAVQIAEGLVPDEIATKNGTRVSTVRSQLSNVLAKLGVARQADIVRTLRQGEALWAKVPAAN